MPRGGTLGYRGGWGAKIFFFRNSARFGVEFFESVGIYDGAPLNVF